MYTFIQAVNALTAVEIQVKPVLRGHHWDQEKVAL